MTLDAIAKHQLFIIQPTSLCNLDCTYCWLPERHVNRKMSNETFVAVIERIAEQKDRLSPSASLVWHGGEPTVMGVGYYRQCLDDMRRIQDVHQFQLTSGIQTNGTLLNRDWIKLVQEYQIDVGVSIDGPAWLHDRKRVYRDGVRGSHADVERGISLLSDAGINFSIIAVLTDDSLDHADEIYGYLSSFKTSGGFAFNVDENDGSNKTTTLLQISPSGAQTRERIKTFFHRILELNEEAGRKLALRDFTQYYDLIDQTAVPAAQYNSMVVPGALVSFDCDGNFSTFCPELIMGHHGGRNPFVFGNVTTDRLDAMATNAQFIRAAKDVLNGRERCRDECDYFSVCGAGSPSNKWAEHGTLDATSTVYCRNHIQAIADAALDYIEGIHVGPSRGRRGPENRLGLG